MTDFSENVITMLDERKVEPRPRWHFLLKRSVFWPLAALSVLVGGVAVSVALYIFFDNDGLLLSGDRAFQEAVLDIAQSIPYIWFAVLGLFTTSTYLIFRRTRKGYRYATARVVGVAIVASVVLGILLDAFDFGQAVHKYLLANTTAYDMLIRSSEDAAD